jgi:HAE1 family hydrophobic/amphiphilic exporter-1
MAQYSRRKKMSITEISVKRPAAITMVIALLIGLGIFGYRSLGADLLPAMNIPVITISTTYSGASADDIKEDIVKPIEDAVSGISGIDQLNSRSKEGVGTVIIRFNEGVDMNSALLDVQKAVDNVQGKLPTDADKPVIYKVDTDDRPVITLALSGVAYDELYNQANKMQTDLENVPGVAAVSLEGAEKKQLFIQLDKSAVDYYGLNINTILNTLEADNVTVPAGNIQQDKLTEAVRVIGQFQSIDDIKNVMIPTTGGGTVRLGDVANVELQYPDPTTDIKLNGKQTVALTIQKQSDANVVEVVNSVKAEMKRIQRTMPKNMHITVANDTTVFINQSLSGIQESLIEGIITTAIVLLLFLKSWKSSLVVLVAIPTSLISTFFMMYEFNFTLNMMSLMGLSLCIGILVDDSIVVLENIQRHLSMGKSPIQAAIEGRKEIGMAAVAITLCDVVVFAPIAFMSGITGQYFKQFGLTIVFATLFSLFVSFTVTPMLASRLFKEKKEEDEKQSFVSKHKDNVIVKLFAKVNAFMEGVTNGYKKLLIWSLNNRGKVIITLVICIALSIALIPLGYIGTEFMAQSDQSTFSISMSLDPGSSLSQTDAKVVQVEKYLNSLKGVEYYFTEEGNNNDTSSAQITVTLVPKADRKKSQSQLAAQVRAMGNKIPGISFQVSESQMGGGGGSNYPVNINISGDDQATLKDLSAKVENEISTIQGITDVNSSLDSDSSEIKVNIDKLAVTEYGVSTSDITAAVRTALQGSSAGTYYAPDDEYDMTLKFMDGQVKSISDIGSIKIQSSSGQSVQLNQVASIIQASSPKSIQRLNRQDVVTISADIQGRPLGNVTNDIQAKIAAMTIPTGYTVSYGGSQRQMGQAFTALGQALLASIVLVYMILVVLYESFLTPLVRMLALPCAIIGALGILALTGNTLNMMSVIGLVMLDGLAAKNGTLLIDYTNTLMKRGMNLREALIAAGTTRLRPIIMTSMTMIVGMLPSALAITEGSETRSGMAWVIIGGMIASTILSPIVLPVVYTLMDDLKNWMFKGHNKKSNVTEVSGHEN